MKTRIENCDQPVVAFAERMQFKLDKNKHKECPNMNPDGKGREWGLMPTSWLLKRAREELDELEEALVDGDIGNARNECADVGNFVMMIHDNISR